MCVCVCALIVIPDEQCGAMVRLWEKQITERLEGASGHDLVQLLFAEQNELEQIAQDGLLRIASWVLKQSPSA